MIFPSEEKYVQTKTTRTENFWHQLSLFFRLSYSYDIKVNIIFPQNNDLIMAFLLFENGVKNIKLQLFIHILLGLIPCSLFWRVVSNNRYISRTEQPLVGRTYPWHVWIFSTTTNIGFIFFPLVITETESFNTVFRGWKQE